MEKNRIHIGTSGWNYPHWKGNFYPGELKQADWLGFYQQRFKDVEINNTFYQLPNENTFAKWRGGTPPGVPFPPKRKRPITHMKKLKDPSSSLEKFLARARLLGDRLGPLLFQLPPRWNCDIQRLADFLAALPQDLRCVFEFRDPSWWNDRVLKLLADHGAAFCVFELAGKRSPKELTADFAYVRLHGPGEAYQGEYGDPALQEWAKTFSECLDAGKEVFCFFDNDQSGFAPKNALRLLEILQGQ